ncbi:kinase-like protein [Gloeophyllum trabeum ATCC 11539]|uniref:Kinase-like protein n=1 Tax=Gloeophyllum trabeum (strain ATCC 11539 / FP-39264 / Madison 617) TaxID=670483 RepID=S7RJM2_GLOTA|nr:kinase-like protein [Gloeophyllum trabeum ATCC 11539]EPQ54535.1 kinase-like protein [Gloeophyllum trabeum ATCC 11539]
MPPLYPWVIANWQLGDKLGSGFSGAIFKARNVHTQEVKALKIQDKNHECPTNRYERHIYPHIQGGKGMPTLWASGIEGPWDYLVIDLLGPSLDSLYRQSGKAVMDLGSVCQIAMQVIARLEFMHAKGVLHRDIQLGNCVVGLPPNHETIYMIDFGFSKCYRDPKTKRHISDDDKKRCFVGNYWFSSVNVHCRGKVPSRRDDLEACALMLIHLLTPGGLSWTRNGVPKTDAAHDRIIREKRRARPEELCRGLPAQFEEFLRYCRRLNFTEGPDYTKWIEEFRELALEHGYQGDDRFVWPPPAPVTQVPRSPAKQPRPSHAPDEVERILHDLANLNLGNRPVLGNRTNILSPTTQGVAATEVQKAAAPSKDEVIVISETSEDTRPRHQTSKISQIASLRIAVTKASDNAALSALVADFVAVLKTHTSKALTKQGFAFLEALYKQLADPSVFIAPLRTSRNSDTHDSSAQEPKHVRMSKLIKLRQEVEKATNNRALAKLVQDFGALTDRSNGRTVTKDGLAFLEGLSRRLEALQ